MRLKKGLTQESLAHEANLARTYIQHIEKGKRNVSLRVVVKITEVFGLTLSEFFKETPNETK